MTTDQHFEKIYQLIEQFDFNELPAEDKSYVLSYLSETEYQNIRETINETKKYFENKSELIPDDSTYNALSVRALKKKAIYKLVNYPLALYKVAASILIILGITFMLFYKSYQNYTGQIAVHDTIFVKKIDTVYSIIRDTIQIVKNIVVYVPQKNDLIIRSTYLANNIVNADCRKELCPSDIERITDLAGINNISKDSFLTNFIVSIK